MVRDRDITARHSLYIRGSVNEKIVIGNMLLISVDGHVHGNTLCGFCAVQCDKVQERTSHRWSNSADRNRP